MMIMRWLALAIMFASIATSAPEARACEVGLLPPRLAGENDAAYRQRIAALEREREAQRPAREAEWLRYRQTEGLEHASMIFIARGTEPPQEHSARRSPPVLTRVEWPPSSYYTPVAWLRGRQVSAPFLVRTSATSCGTLVGVGDANPGDPGAQFVFFASGEPFTGLTLMDAIAIDKVTDPTLVAFVARSRR
jgi:hypothetical protein